MDQARRALPGRHVPYRESVGNVAMMPAARADSRI